MESDSEGEENEDEVVVEVDQRLSSLSLQDRVANRKQVEHMRVSHIAKSQTGCFVEKEHISKALYLSVYTCMFVCVCKHVCAHSCVCLCMPCRWS